MKLRALLALALVAAAALSGCFGSDDEPTDDHCDDGHADADCPANELGTDTGLGNETAENETVVPNVPPTVALLVFDDGGNETRQVMLGGNLTFDASGSVDSDGSVDQAAITVADSNQTRTATLFSNGKFTPATFNFDRPGVVNVTLSVIDDAGEIVSLLTQVFVSHPQLAKSHQFKTPAPPTLAADSCDGTGADPYSSLGDSTYYKQFKFEVLEGATWAEAKVAGGSASIAICDPDGVALSDVGTEVTTADGTNFTQSISYFVSATSGTWVPVDTSPSLEDLSNNVIIDIIVYYGERPAA